MSQCNYNLVQLHRPVNKYILSNIAKKTRENIPHRASMDFDLDSMTCVRTSRSSQVYATVSKHGHRHCRQTLQFSIVRADLQNKQRTCRSKKLQALFHYRNNQ